MTPTTRPADADLEARVRAMLARRAADVAPGRPAPPHPALVPPTAGRPSRTRRRLLVAAVALVLVGAATLAVRNGGGDGPTTVAEGPDASAVPDPEALPTPHGRLDGTDALALYARRGTAAEVARAYLADRVPNDPGALVLDDGRTTQATVAGGGAVAIIPWHPTPAPSGTADDPADRYSGEVQLQQIDGGWAVVAATTDQIAVRAIAREAETVSFTVDRLDDAAIDLMDMAVFDLEGRPVGEPISAPLGVPGTYEIDIGPGVDPDEPLTLRIRHVGGTWFSLTEVRVPPQRAGAVSPR